MREGKRTSLSYFNGVPSNLYGALVIFSLEIPTRWYYYFQFKEGKLRLSDFMSPLLKVQKNPSLSVAI